VVFEGTKGRDDLKAVRRGTQSGNWEEAKRRRGGGAKATGRQ